MPNEFRVGDVVRRVYDSPHSTQSTPGFNTGWGVVGEEYVLTRSTDLSLFSSGWGNGTTGADPSCFELVSRAAENLITDTGFESGGWVSSASWTTTVAEASMLKDNAGKPIKIGNHVLVVERGACVSECKGQVAKILSISPQGGLTLEFPWLEGLTQTCAIGFQGLDIRKVEFVPGDLVEGNGGSGYGTYRIEKVDLSSWGELHYYTDRGGYWPEGSAKKVGTSKLIEHEYKVGDLILLHNAHLHKITRLESNSVWLEGRFYSYSLNEIKPFTMPDDMVKWGGYVDNTHDKRLVDFLSFGDHFHHTLTCFGPAIKVEGDQVKIALTKSKEEYDRGRRVVMKVGRAIKLMYPDYDDKKIEVLVDQIRKKFTPRSYIIKTSTEPDSFKHAYQSAYGRTENLNTTSSRKALANSCMRHEFDQPHHPCEAYGSGDFLMVWTEDTDGKIGSRCVVCINHNDGDEWRAGPIYGVDERSIDVIEEYILKNNGKLFHQDWSGARLLRLEDKVGLMGPYFDNGQSLTDEGDYLVVSNNGEIATCSYSGYLEGSRACCDCGNGVHEDNTYTSPDGETYCESCYCHHWVYCELSGEDIRRDEAIEVYQTSRWGRNTTYRHSSDEGINFYQCTYTDEYWDEDEIVFTYDDEPVCKSYAESNLTLCEESDKWCDPSDILNIKGKNYHKKEIKQVISKDEAA